LKVKVRLHATLRRHTPEGYQNRLEVELEEGAKVASLLELLELDVEPQHLLMVVNRRRVEPEDMLADGVKIDLFPPISGGKSA
jgi:molybdopterin converting factor small subunit